MATTFESRTTPGNRSGTGQLRIEPPPGRRARLPELVVGTALMIGFALAAVLWHMSSTDRQPALALADSVSRGEVIKASDLRVVYLSSDAPIARLSKGEAAAVVGHSALSDLAAGTLLTRASVAPRLTVGPGEGLVGLSLEPGQVPAANLLPGDVVNVIAGPTNAVAVQPEGGGTAVLAARAVVVAVGSTGTQGRRFVSVKLPEAEANRVAAAAERGPVRLVLVAA